MMGAKAAIFTALLTTISSGQAAEWDYSGTNWTIEYPTCGGSSQSPINIDTDTIMQADYSDFSFSIGYRIAQMGTLENNGHTLKFTVDESFGAGISGGPLNGSYTLNQLHLHWGSQSDQGSEHTVDGQSYDGELHLVHYKSTYDNISAAIADNQTDSLAVVGIFLREATQWDQWRGVKDAESIQHLRAGALGLSRPWKGSAYPTVDVEIVLDQLLSGITDLSGLYHYEGGLTTPGCAEIVQWIVMETPIHIRENGLIQALRKNIDLNGETLQDNYRPTQAVHGRNVYHYQPGVAVDIPTTTEDPNSSGPALMVIYEINNDDGNGVQWANQSMEIVNLDNSSSLPTCLDGIIQPFPIPDAKIEPGAFHILQDGTPLYCTWAPDPAGGCFTFEFNSTSNSSGSWTKFGDRTSANMPGGRPAQDYNPNVGLMIAAGEGCFAGIQWCKTGTRKTLLSSDGGATFSELADFPEDTEETCGVFLNDTAFMVIGGRFVSGNDQERDTTWIYDVVGDTWSAGAALPEKRSQHICKRITDLDGTDKVVVTSGYTPGAGRLNSTLIYDIDSGTWSTGNDYPLSVAKPGAVYYQDSFLVAGGVLHDGTRAGDIYFYDIANGGTWTNLNVTLDSNCHFIHGNCWNPALVVVDNPCP